MGQWTAFHDHWKPQTAHDGGDLPCYFNTIETPARRGKSKAIPKYPAEIGRRFLLKSWQDMAA